MRNVTAVLDISIPSNCHIVQGVAAYMHEVGNWRLRVAESPLESIPDPRSWKCDGLIASFYNQSVASAILALGVPIVDTGGGKGWYDPESGIPYLGTDNRAIAQMAARHLIEQGYRHFGFCGYRRTKRTDWSAERAEAFRETVGEAGYRCHTFLASTSHGGRWSNRRTGLPAWLAARPRPLAVMACNDGCAQRVLDACRVAGLKVPDDVGLVGVDNNEMMCRLADPPLTSIEQGYRTLGYEAARTLDLLMRGRKPPAMGRVIPPERLIARRSTDVFLFDDTDLCAALEFVRRHACDPIRVADVLTAVQLSRSTLERKFHAALGRSIHAEIRRVQIAHACELLARPELMVKQVARRSGFRTVQYLSAVFREATGQKPSDYRREKLRGLWF
jgi:LacI family transcriptional regulator